VDGEGEGVSEMTKIEAIKSAIERVYASPCIVNFGFSHRVNGNIMSAAKRQRVCFSGIMGLEITQISVKNILCDRVRDLLGKYAAPISAQDANGYSDISISPNPAKTILSCYVARDSIENAHRQQKILQLLDAGVHELLSLFLPFGDYGNHPYCDLYATKCPNLYACNKILRYEQEPFIFTQPLSIFQEITGKSIYVYDSIPVPVEKLADNDFVEEFFNQETVEKAIKLAKGTKK
jgi:hypothetical protein